MMLHVNKILDSINYPDLRLATVNLVTANIPQNDAPSKATYTWARSSPKAVNGKDGFAYYSATCYYFGKQLYKAMHGNVPIGLITSCWGGQTVEVFSSPDALSDKTCGGTRPRHEDDHENYDQLHYDNQNNEGSSNEDSIDQPQPTQLWNAMIHPLRKMRFVGVIWYQGESNAGDPLSYACRFPAMITDWRQKFQLPDLSFVFVQLAGYRQDNFPLIRAAQLAALQLPQVGFATAIDLGDPSSTSGAIHPRRKQEVGRRLSLTVRSLQYNERGGLVYTGPILNGVQIDDSGYLVRISFESGTADGLHTAGSPECDACCSELPFHVLDTSGKWIRVGQGQINGNELYLSSKNVRNVYGIRYAWEGYPQCLLYNGIGGPDNHVGIAAAPFEWCAYPSGNPSWTDKACNVPSMEVSTLAINQQEM
jgi:sialate O-acetylesterase